MNWERFIEGSFFTHLWMAINARSWTELPGGCSHGEGSMVLCPLFLHVNVPTVWKLKVGLWANSPTGQWSYRLMVLQANDPTGQWSYRLKIKLLNKKRNYCNHWIGQSIQTHLSKYLENILISVMVSIQVFRFYYF